MPARSHVKEASAHEQNFKAVRSSAAGLCIGDCNVGEKSWQCLKIPYTNYPFTIDCCVFSNEACKKCSPTGDAHRYLIHTVMSPANHCYHCPFDEARTLREDMISVKGNTGREAYSTAFNNYPNQLLTFQANCWSGSEFSEQIRKAAVPTISQLRLSCKALQVNVGAT